MARLLLIPPPTLYPRGEGGDEKGHGAKRFHHEGGGLRSSGCGGRLKGKRGRERRIVM
jgi:hypothetical protein